jgi:hypothetical protein
MSKTRIEILIDECLLPEFIDEDYTIEVRVINILEAMKRFGELAFNSSRERIYSESDREVMAKYRDYETWIKEEEQK